MLGCISECLLWNKDFHSLWRPWDAQVHYGCSSSTSMLKSWRCTRQLMTYSPHREEVRMGKWRQEPAWGDNSLVQSIVGTLLFEGNARQICQMQTMGLWELLIVPFPRSEGKNYQWCLISVCRQTVFAAALSVKVKQKLYPQGTGVQYDLL